VLNKIKQYVKNKYIMRKYEGGITTLENVDSEKNIGVNSHIPRVDGLML
jgi:hypothetical protein